MDPIPSLDPLDLDRIERYLGGHLSPSEAEAFAAWLAQDGWRQRALDDCTALWNSLSADQPRWDVQDMWQAVVARTQLDGHVPLPPRAAATSRRTTPRHAIPVVDRSPQIFGVPRARRSVLWSLAATLGVAGIVAGLWFTTHRGSVGTDQQVFAEGSWKSYSTVRGQRADVRLNDGTKITLAADSRVRVREEQGRQIREVELVGEAYFDVTPDAAHPFVVHTRQGIVRELGTAFDVRSYPGDTTVNVVVTTGRVSLGAAHRHAEAVGTPVVLAAGDWGQVGPSGATSIAHHVDLRSYIGWLNGELVFTAQPLQTVVDAIERWYDVKIEFADPAFASLPLTVSIRDGSLNDALDVITRSLQLSAERDGRVIRLVKHNSSR
jgi:ferric-dicitrate binding protein FerR (iron transport regulator)